MLFTEATRTLQIKTTNPALDGVKVTYTINAEFELYKGQATPSTDTFDVMYKDPCVFPTKL